MLLIFSCIYACTFFYLTVCLYLLGFLTFCLPISLFACFSCFLSAFCSTCFCSVCLLFYLLVLSAALSASSTFHQLVCLPFLLLPVYVIVYLFMCYILGPYSSCRLSYLSLSFCLSVSLPLSTCLCIYIYLYPSQYNDFSMFVCLPTYPCTYFSLCLSIYPSIHPSLLSTFLLIYVSRIRSTH